MPVFHPQKARSTVLSGGESSAMLAPSLRPEPARGRVEHTTEPTAENLWESIAGRLREALTETTYETWFGQAGSHSLKDGALVIEVPNDFTREWIEGHFLDFVSGAAREALGSEVVVTFAVAEGRTATPPPAQAPAESDFREPRRGASVPGYARGRAQLEVHVRSFRHRLLEPLRACRRPRGRRSAGSGL